MKYKTFRNGLLVGALLLVGAGAWTIGRGVSQHGPVSNPQVEREPPPMAPLPSAPAGVANLAGAPPASGASEHDAPGYATFLRQQLGRSASGEKQKDALGRLGPKVNVYAEQGHWTRAKVDLDRDERWDEKWWVDAGQIWRAIAPQDDEHYGEKTLVGPASK